ncbi:unnamed protein product, partial [marine sediment metagenome]
TIEGTSEGYGVIVDQGVKAERIPYSGRSGGGKSKYIEGLKQYAILRMGVDESEALGIAFAIANTHIKQGMPTTASNKYSGTGKRTDFIEEALRKIEPQLVREIELWGITSIEIILNNIAKQTQNKISVS